MVLCPWHNGSSCNVCICILISVVGRAGDVIVPFYGMFGFY